MVLTFRKEEQPDKGVDSEEQDKETLGHDPDGIGFADHAEGDGQYGSQNQRPARNVGHAGDDFGIER